MTKHNFKKINNRVILLTSKTRTSITLNPYLPNPGSDPVNKVP